MGEPITKPSLESAIESAVRNLPPTVPPAEVAKRVVTDPKIAPALKPISRLKSETMQGIAITGVAWFLQVTGLGETTTILLNLVGFEPEPAKVSTVLTTVLTLGGLGYAWYGRETTSRPLA